MNNSEQEENDSGLSPRFCLELVEEINERMKALYKPITYLDESTAFYPIYFQYSEYETGCFLFMGKPLLEGLELDTIIDEKAFRKLLIDRLAEVLDCYQRNLTLQLKALQQVK